MSTINARTLKGFRDFLPKEARKRQYVINTLKQVFELYGFEPLETPALEYEEILSGKYGEEGDKLMYKFEDLGKRKVALRYDQTVPLARVVAQYGSTGSPQVLPMPFKRYQIQPVWRAENPQKGRFREFLQCDADIVGSSSPLSDAEAIAVAAKAIEKLGFSSFKIWINDRNGLREALKLPRVSIAKDRLDKVMAAIDELEKIGKEAVMSRIEEVGFTTEESSYLFREAESSKETEWTKEVRSNLKKDGLGENVIKFSPVLARGLDYYTSTIFEIQIKGYSAGSVCGGGRYDNLIGMFSGRQVPAVGFAFGFDRLIEAMEELKLFPSELDGAKVLVTIFSSELKDESIKVCSELRLNNIKTELYLDENAKLDKQLKYADQKEIPYVLIIGPSEIEKNQITIKNLRTKEQKTVSKEDLVKSLS